MTHTSSWFHKALIFGAGFFLGYYFAGGCEQKGRTYTSTREQSRLSDVEERLHEYELQLNDMERRLEFSSPLESDREYIERRRYWGGEAND